jgi:hypothetical protein
MKASIAMVRHADINLSSAVGNHGQTTDPAILPVIGGDRLRLHYQKRARRGSASRPLSPTSAGGGAWPIRSTVTNPLAAAGGPAGPLSRGTVSVEQAWVERRASALTAAGQSGGL